MIRIDTWDETGGKMVVLEQLLKVWTFLFQNLIFVNLILSFIIIFFQRREPKSVWTWLLILYFVPIVGFLLYLVIGQDMHKSKMFRTKEIEDELNSAIRKQEEIILKSEYDEREDFPGEYADLILYNLESAGAIYTDDNEVEIYTDGNEKFNALIDEIRKAKSYIHIQYYIIRDDELFDRIQEALIEKVREGVEVRILFDSMGCRHMKRRTWDRLRREGIMTAEFFPALLKRLHLRVNYRNHRKIVVIDGKTAFLGGFNIGKEYIGLAKKFGYWRDTHLKISGSAVRAVQVRFILDWNYASKENLLLKNQYFFQPDSMMWGDNGIQIISSGPDSKLQNIRNNYLRLISKAEKSIYIQTPYFIPDESITEALKIAALSGINVNVMIPCKPDHPFVYWATYSYVGDLIDAGANCYVYNNGFLHAKGIVVDGKVLCYGTANMDIRSFKLNFEVNAVIYNEKTAALMEEKIKEDLKYCTLVTHYIYAKRSLLVRVKEQFSRLLSPLL